MKEAAAHPCPTSRKNKRKRDETEATLRAKESVSQDDGRSGSSEDRIESAEADASERGTQRGKGGEENEGGVEDMLTPAQRRFRDQQLAREVSWNMCMEFI